MRSAMPKTHRRLLQASQRGVSAALSSVQAGQTHESSLAALLHAKIGQPTVQNRAAHKGKIGQPNMAKNRDRKSADSSSARACETCGNQPPASQPSQPASQPGLPDSSQPAPGSKPSFLGARSWSLNRRFRWELRALCQSIASLPTRCLFVNPLPLCQPVASLSTCCLFVNPLPVCRQVLEPPSWPLEPPSEVNPEVRPTKGK